MFEKTTASAIAFAALAVIAGCDRAGSGAETKSAAAALKSHWDGRYEIKKFECKNPDGSVADHCHVEPNVRYKWAIKDPASGSLFYELTADVKDADGDKVESQGFLWAEGSKLVGPVQTWHRDASGNVSAEFHWVVLSYAPVSGTDGIDIEMCDRPEAGTWNKCSLLQHLGAGHGDE